eukprot:gene4150-5238_t
MSKGYQLSTPKLWPENAEYVTGYPKKKHPTSSTYLNQTTLGSAIHPTSSGSLLYTTNLTLEEESELVGLTQLERAGSLVSRPLTQQNLFHAKWSEKVGNKSTTSLKDVYSRPSKKPTSRHQLRDPTDKLRYARSTALVLHTQSADVLKYQSRVQRSAADVPHRLKWKQCIVTLAEIRVRLKKDQTVTDVIMDMCMKLHLDSVRHGEGASGIEDVVSRIQFIRSISSVAALERLPTTNHSLLFSVFDPINTNLVKIVDFISAFIVLNNPEESALDKLVTLWRLYERYEHNLPPLDVCGSVLGSCCGDANDRSMINEVFKNKFRPACFRLAVYKESGRSTDAGEGGDQPPLSPVKTKPEDDVSPERAGRPGHESGAALPPVYNICDEYMCCDMFIEVLKMCPAVVAVFDDQLSARLAECYGRDP